MKKLLFPLLLICSLTVGSGLVAETSPTGELKPVLDELTSVLGDASLKGKDHLTERREKIMTIVKRRFDFQEMSKRVLGSTWRDLDSKEQEHFTQLMTKLLENVYIGKLEGYSGQTVTFVDETVRKDRAQVTTLIDDGNMKIPVHYIMRKKGSIWMVYDINIEGVSLVRNYQEQFKSILRTENYQGLVKVLEEKNQSFLEEAK